MKRCARALSLLISIATIWALGGIAQAQDAPATASSASASPAGATDPEATEEKVVYTVGSPYDLVSPNPFKACCTMDYEMIGINYDLLFNFGKTDLAPESGLGIWPPTVSEDSKTWTIKIREGVTWSDGTPFTAYDVAFTYSFIADNKLAAFDDYLGEPESFTAPDDTTFVWKMKTASLSPLTPPFIPILPEHIWAPLDGKPPSVIKEFKNIPAIGTGPFQLAEWKEGQFVRFVANPHYWGPKPAVDESIYRTYENAEGLALALETSEIDFAYQLTPALFNRLKDNPDITTNLANIVQFDNLAFNFEGSANPALRDEQVRLAISHGIDRQTLVDRVLLGNGTIGDSVVDPTFSRWYTPTAPEDVQEYDPALAEQILDDAGYLDTDEDGVREGPDGPLTIELLTISDETYSTASGKLIAGWLNAIGFDASVKTVNTTKAYDLWGSQDFDAYIWGWSGDPDPDFILSIFTSKQCDPPFGWSDGCYKDLAYDAMYKEQHFELDPEKRIEQVAAMQKYLYEKNPEIVLYYQRNLQAYRNDTFTGYVLNPEPVGSALFQWAPYTYQTLRPVESEASGAESGTGEADADGWPTWAWVGLALVLVVGIGLVVMMRRSQGQEDTE